MKHSPPDPGQKFDSLSFECAALEPPRRITFVRLTDPDKESGFALGEPGNGFFLCDDCARGLVSFLLKHLPGDVH